MPTGFKLVLLWVHPDHRRLPGPHNGPRPSL